MIRLSRTLGAVLGAILFTACGGGPTDTVPDQPLDEKEQEISADPGKPVAKDAKDHADGKHGKGRGGPAMLLRAALAKLTLDAGQKQKIEGLLVDLGKGGPGHSAESRALEKSIVHSVRSGSFDDAVFAKHYAAIETEAKSHSQKLELALDELHRTLSVAQRDELVTALEARKRDGKGQGRARKGKSERGGFDRGHGHERGLVDLGLSDEQRQKLESAREAKPGFGRGNWKERGGQMLTAFRAADFDAKKLVNADEMARHAKSFAEMRVKRAKTLSDVLTPEQRTKYAVSLETRSRGEKH